MNASVVSSAVAASNPIVTPIANLIGEAIPQASMVSGATSQTAEAATSAVTATSATEKVILGVSQKNLIVGGCVIGGAALLGGGLFAYNKVKSIPKNAIEIVLSSDSTAMPGVTIGLNDGSKLGRDQKKMAKEISSAMRGLDARQVFSSIEKIAASDTPNFMGVDLRHFPGTTVQFNNVADRCAFGAALVNQATYRKAGYPTILEYSRDDKGGRPVIRVIPVVRGQELRNYVRMDIEASEETK